MRKAINENRTVQLGLLGGLLLVVALLLVTRMGKKDEEAPPASASPTAATGAPVAGETTSPSTAAATTSSTTGAAPTGPAAAATAAVTPLPATVTPEALVPGPGLPRPVITAWNHGDAIVLLVVRPKGTDDRLVRRSVESLSEPGVAVFVAPANRIARYSRITQGVGVSRVPALVVVRPKRLSGGTPLATVSFGFRNSQSVVQAVHDALYSGRDDIPYNPG
jgi:hypothetical protein